MLTESQVSLSEAFLQVHEKTSLQGSRRHKVSVTAENSGCKEHLFKNDYGIWWILVAWITPDIPCSLCFYILLIFYEYCKSLISSVVKEKAGAPFSREAPQMFCGPRNYTQLLNGMGAINDFSLR